MDANIFSLFLQFNNLNIPCYLSLDIGFLIQWLCNLCLTHNGGKLLHRLTCHSSDVKFLGLLIDFFPMHIVMNN